MGFENSKAFWNIIIRASTIEDSVIKEIELYNLLQWNSRLTFSVDEFHYIFPTFKIFNT